MNEFSTRVVCLYGGPGTGKSTTAAALFAALKNRGVTVELVREYVKDWAWMDRRVSTMDQFYVFGAQLQRESILYGKVEVIVTDAPTGLSAYYAHKYCPIAVAEALKACHEAMRCSSPATYIDVMLTRTKDYDPRGRWETAEQARLIDLELRAFLQTELRVPFTECGTENLNPILELLNV